MNNLCVIPARGGSKRIPRKNIRSFLGRPIIAYSIEAALKSNLFSEVMVSTEDNEIAEIAKYYGAKVPFFRREETANDYATTTDVIIEVLNAYNSLGKEFENVACIYSTAPFVTAENIKKAFSKMNNEIDSVFTAVAYSYPIQRSLRINNEKISMIYPKYLNTRSQDLETVYHDAGQFYISRVKSFMKNKTFWGKNTAGLILSELEVQDLDTLTDWQLAEMKYKLIHSIDM